MSKSKIADYVSAGLLSVALILVHSVSAQAQAILQVSGTATAITKTGHTELVGTVTFTVASGTTVAGTLEFFLPNITFTNTGGTSGITVTGTGSLAGATLLNVVPDGGIVLINLPAGGVAGAQITVAGIRISAVGKTFTSLNAQLSSTSGNSIVAGQNSIRVVSRVTDGLIVENEVSPTVTVVNGGLITGPGTFILREGAEASFSSAVGVAGQTAKTQIVFKVVGLPDNVSVTFPSPVVSNSGATLLTLSGTDVALTNQSASNTVVYEFNDSVTSPVLLDTFSIAPSVGSTGVVGTGTATIQAALGPIGAAVPNDDFPSTAVPRFDERFLPAAPGPPPGVPTVTTFPVPDSVDDQTITLFNSASGGATITARARASDGTPVGENTFTLLSQQTRTASLKDLFGTAASSSSIATVEFESLNNRLVINSVASIGARRFSVSPLAQTPLTYLPFDRQTGADIPVLSLYNPGASAASATVTLFASAGTTVATASRILAAGGAVRENFSSLFGSASLPLEGYITVRSSVLIRSVLINNPASRPDDIPTLFASAAAATFPFFAFGGGYNTRLTLINPSDTESVRVTLNAYRTTGAPVTSQPFVRMLNPRERQNLDFAAVFASVTVPANQIVVGYFSFSLEGATPTNPFASPPQVFALTRVSTNNFSVPVPFGDAATRFFITPTIETPEAYTGLAIQNTISSPVTVTVDLFAAGTAQGSTTFTLDSNTVRIQLLREMIPQSLNHQNGTVRISSTPAGVRAFAFRGTLNLSELIYLGGVTLP